MRLLRLVLAFTAILFCVQSAHAEHNWMRLLFKCGDDVCVIRKNHGGIPITFGWAAERALEKGTKIRIDGICSSACVIFASKVRENTCITERARMGIHMGRTPSLHDRKGREVDEDKVRGFKTFDHPPPRGYHIVYKFFLPDYGEDINAWALKESKMPATINVYVMTPEEALRYWKPCK